MQYALRTIWFERKRFIPGIVAVAFSAVLIALQTGILLGLIGVVSVPIVNSKAQIWIGYKDTLSVDLGRPIPTRYAEYVWANPNIETVNEYVQSFTFWTTTSGQNELAIVMGTNVSPESIGPVDQLDPEELVYLTEPGSIVVDRNDADRLEASELGSTGESFGRRLRIVGFVPDMGSISGPYLLCSLSTARMILRMPEDKTTYLLATVKDPTKVDQVIDELNAAFPDFTAFEAERFSTRSKMHWLTKTKAGIAIGFVALLGLAVGASVTSQTLYAATVASIRELAVLRALGIPGWRISVYVLQQAIIVGILGLVTSGPVAYALAQLARRLGTHATLPTWLITSTIVVTLTMSLFSGLIALRSLKHAEPASLLR
ncbi:FtsX-like permease family protein [Planctomycetes bacterium Pan216]|uniref:FtsX-like permease family protein n=1 Tax=Kolteria novifilia TaxID=2527975 RepID=A0A518B871_9BACT|nr:FtsX-like permease family protein [Planctomycetes bacterium Pan216]